MKSEDDPLDPDPPQEFRHALTAIQYLEGAVTTSTATEGIVLRYGALYGDNTGMFDGPFVDQVRRRRAPVIDGWWSFLFIDDAAQATAAAIERGKAGNIYNIADDEPAPVREWLPVLAHMLGARPPFHVPAWIARLMAPEHIVAMMTQQRAGSNAKAKRELGWQPAHASWRQGFAEVVGRRQQGHAA